MSRDAVKNLLAGVATSLDQLALVDAGGPNVARVFPVVAELFRAIATVVGTHGVEAVQKAIRDLAKTPAKRADLEDAEAAVASALADREDAPVEPVTE